MLTGNVTDRRYQILYGDVGSKRQVDWRGMNYSAPYRLQQQVHYCPHVGEVPRLAAVPVDGQWATLPDGIEKRWNDGAVCISWSLCGTVHVEESQNQDGHAEAARVAKYQILCGELGDSVRAAAAESVTDPTTKEMSSPERFSACPVLRSSNTVTRQPLTSARRTN
jgi:hypothetical protein